MFTDTSKEGWDTHLGEHTAKGTWSQKANCTARGTWSLSESKLHVNYLELMAVFFVLKEFQDICSGTHSCSNRQHHSGCLCKQGRRHEVRSTVCLTVENPDVVFLETSDSQGPTHSRLAECGSRQAIQARSNHPDRGVSPSRGLPVDMQQVAPTINRSICDKVQQPNGSISITSTRSSGLASQCTQPILGGSGPICLPTSSHLGQSGGKVTVLPMQENHSDCSRCSRVAQHTLVLGSSGYVKPDPSVPAQPAQATTQPFNQAPHRNLLNLNLHAWLLEPQLSESKALYK